MNSSPSFSSSFYPATPTPTRMNPLNRNVSPRPASSNSGYYGPKLNAPQYVPPPRQQQPFPQTLQPPPMNHNRFPPPQPRQPQNQGNDTTYILFYSSYCLNSKEFLNALCKSPLYEQFRRINISEPNFQCPPFLKNVPTIIVPDADVPLEGENVFRWLEQQCQGNGDSTETNGIQPYFPGEMDMSLGADYSYLGVDARDQPMEKSFVFLNRPEEKIKTPPEESFGEKKKNIMPTRAPMMQNQQQSFSKPASVLPSIPQDSNFSDKENVEKAYEELLSRRKLENINRN
jgi:hypothetical protein